MSARPLEPPTGASAGDWSVQWWEGTAEELHSLDVPATRLVRVHRVLRPALVLGSAQRICPGGIAPDGIALARRRSGGGAVWLAPGEQVWVDLVIPADDPLSEADLSRSARWAGEVWAAALSGQRAGPASAPALRVHAGAPLRRELGAVACFAGVSAGELTSGEGPDAPKVLGISQHRSRLRSRFQCVVYLHWDPRPLLGAMPALGVDPGLIAGMATVLSHGVLPVAAEVGHSGELEWGVVERLLTALP